jgi:Domain of unknown function (DUF4105)
VPRARTNTNRRRFARAAQLLIIAAALLSGCRTAEKIAAPSNFRDWAPEQAVLPYAEFQGNQVTIHNIRNCHYFAEDTFLVDYYDKTIDLNSLRSVDFITVPFESLPALAHTMLSFEFIDPNGRPEHLAVSVETRKEKDQTYNPVKGSARQYELMYVVADERDVIQQRTNYRGDRVYLYRTTATPDASRMLLVDMLGRVNQLRSNPEFYNTLTNNCSTNIVQHINRIKPNRINYDVRVLLPGYSDQLAYEDGLIVPYGTFEQTKQRALVTPFAQRYADREDFSELIRLR